MCNPTLIVAGASAVLQYQVANAQQKAIQDQQKRQNEIALASLDKRRVASASKLITKTKAGLEKGILKMKVQTAYIVAKSGQEPMLYPKMSVYPAR